MQAIMAAAIALDAFYAVIKTKAEIPETLIKKWKVNGTARYKQLSEVLRQAFMLKKEESALLQESLKEIFRFRDLAVHPRAENEAPVFHPEIHVGVEWRFACFRAENAALIVCATQNMIRELVSKGKPKNPAISGIR
jgi:hypothetical protein